MPGFAVSLVECAGSLRFSSCAKSGVKTDGNASVKCFYRNHVPRGTWCDVCGYEINVFLRIREAGALFHPVTSQDRESGLAALAFCEARFHLHARQAPAVLDEKIEGMAVAVWLRDADAFTCRPIHERELGELAHTFGAKMP